MSLLPDYLNNPKQRRQFIKYQIADSVWLNYSGAEILRILQSQGLGINRSDFYQIQRERLDIIARVTDFENLNPNELIPKAKMITQSDWDMSRDYLYQFRIIGTEPNTTNFKIQMMAISSDDQFTPSQAYEKMLEAIIGHDELYGISYTDIELIRVYTKPS